MLKPLTREHTSIHMRLKHRSLKSTNWQKNSSVAAECEDSPLHLPSCRRSVELRTTIVFAFIFRTSTLPLRTKIVFIFITSAIPKHEIKTTNSFSQQLQHNRKTQFCISIVHYLGSEIFQGVRCLESVQPQSHKIIKSEKTIRRWKWWIT
jgi:hypothetical protein